MEKQMPLVILCDVDDVIAPMLAQGWLPLYNADFGDNLTAEDITGWELRNFVKPEARSVIYDYLAYENLYDNVLPEKGSLDAIKKLKARGNRVVYTTTGIFPAKVRWLYRHGFLDPKTNPVNAEKDLVITGDKSLIRGDVIIDDKPSTIYSCEDRMFAIMFNRPHNRKEEYPIRVNSWTEVLDEISLYFGYRLPL